MKKQADWDAVLANDISDKELLSKIHKELSKFTNKKTKSLKNGQSWTANTKHTQIANKHLKIYSHH